MARSGVGNIQTEEIRVEREDKHRIVGEILFFFVVVVVFSATNLAQKIGRPDPERTGQ